MRGYRIQVLLEKVGVVGNRVEAEAVGRDLAERALDARSRVLRSTVAELDSADVRDLERLLGALLDATTAVGMFMAASSAKLGPDNATGTTPGITSRAMPHMYIIRSGARV